MAEGVVDLLEAIEVEQHDCELVGKAVGAEDLGGEDLFDARRFAVPVSESIRASLACSSVQRNARRRGRASTSVSSISATSASSPASITRM